MPLEKDFAGETDLSSANQASLFGARLIPLERKISAESWNDQLETTDLYDPQAVQVNQVTGGFNTAVQISSSYSLRSYAEQIGKVGVIARTSGSRLERDLARISADLIDPWWATQVLDPASTYGFGLELAPAQLVFSDGRLATVTFQGTISFMTKAIVVQPGVVEPQSPVVPQTLPGDLKGVDIVAQVKTDAGAAASMPTTMHTMGSSPVPRMSVFERDARATHEIFDLTPMVASHRVGQVKVTLSAPYDSTEHVAQRSVDVWMNMKEAKIVVKPDAGDAKLFYDSFLAPMANELAAQIAPVAQIPLAPSISLVGRNPANGRVAEFSEFETRVFHVAERKRQALCIAFDVVPGCKGIIENVRHFIGAQDYGVIHDEYTVERIVRHKWNQGGFDRSMNLSAHVSLQVMRDGRDSMEDGSILGELVLNTLDFVALVPHPDLRTDVLSIGGQAQAVPDRIVLADGTILTRDKIDLGTAQDTNWGANISPALYTAWDRDPEVRDFQARAHDDGIRHLSRPFSRFPIQFGFPEVQYARTEGVQKRIFFLGQLPVVFS